MCRSVRYTGIHPSGLTASISLCRFQSVSTKLCPDCIPLAAHLSKCAHIHTYTHTHTHTHTCTHTHIHKCTHTHTRTHTHTHTHDLFVCVANPIPYLFFVSLACVCSTIPSVPYMSLFIVCLWIDMHVSLPPICLYTSLYTYICLCMCICHIFAHVCIYICIYTLAHECLFTYVFVCDDSFADMPLYISVFTHGQKHGGSRSLTDFPGSCISVYIAH